MPDTFALRQGDKLRHYKGGIYTFISFGMDKTRDEEIVIYTDSDGEWYSRTITDMWEWLPEHGCDRFEKVV